MVVPTNRRCSSSWRRWHDRGQFERCVMRSTCLILFAHWEVCNTAGIPTLIRPWFGYVHLSDKHSPLLINGFSDQFFWASRVHKLGVSDTPAHQRLSHYSLMLIICQAGMRVTSLRSSVLAHALTRATTNRYCHLKSLCSLHSSLSQENEGPGSGGRRTYSICKYPSNLTRDNRWY